MSVSVRVGRAADWRAGAGCGCFMGSWKWECGLVFWLCSKLMDTAQVLASNGVSSNRLLNKHEANVSKNSQ